LNWHVAGETLKRLNLFHRVWATKWCTRWLPFGKHLLDLNPAADIACPRCGEEEMEASSILRCPAAATVWQKSIHQLDGWMAKHDTLPELRTTVIRYLSAWHRQRPLQPAECLWPNLSYAIDEQTELGWFFLFEGVMLQSWIDAQQAYFVWRDKRNTGQRWATALLEQFWKISWDMWKHRADAWKDCTSAAGTAENTRLDREIREQFEVPRTHWTTRERRWFHFPPPTIYARPISDKSEWVLHVRAIRHRYSNRANPGQDLERQLMRRFLHRRPLPPSTAPQL
jgi:hypothetical protein